MAPLWDVTSLAAKKASCGARPSRQVAEARQQCEAAGAEAAAARERALTAEREAAGTLVRLAETQKREAEVREGGRRRLFSATRHAAFVCGVEVG